MSANELIAEVTRQGGALEIHGDRIRYRFPNGAARKLLEELRAHREELLEALRQNIAVAHEYSPIETQSVPAEDQWPPQSYDALARFGQSHARLFPLLGRKIRTPAGPGTLLQVFADHVTVLLDCDISKCSSFSPGEIEPVSTP